MTNEQSEAYDRIDRLIRSILGDRDYAALSKDLDCVLAAPPPAVEGEREAFEPMTAFLMGEAPLDGVWFGGRHPTLKGEFWWRSKLRAALAARPADGTDVQWIDPHDRVPEKGQSVIVFSQQTWEKAPSLKIDAWDEQREAPVPFSSATISIGDGWDGHDDFESVIAWTPLPAPPVRAAAEGDASHG